jgi:FAD/FMN-containing dehydrogenase/Fe-S oxidoreductase
VSATRAVDVDGLATALRRAIGGEVRFDAGSRALYATDASNYRQVPIGVVLPRDVDDVVATVATAQRFGAPLLPRGGGTGLAGQTTNVAVVMDLSKYVRRLLELDITGRRAHVEPGIVLDALRTEAERYRLTFGPDPSTHNRCTLGGMLGNNSCGVHSVLAEFYGPGPRTADSVERLEVLTYDGLRLDVGPTSEAEIERVVGEGGRRGAIYGKLRALRDRYAALIRARFPDIPRRVSGYDLTQLLPERGFNLARALVGTEGTCVTILGASVTLVPSPPARALLVLGYPSVFEAGDHVPQIREHKPIGLEGLDDRLVDDMVRKRLHPANVRLLPEGRGWLLVEFGGDRKADAHARAQRLMDALRSHNGHAPSMKLYDDPATEHVIWTVRESGLGATARVPGQPDTWEGWEDSAVPPARLGDYLRGLRRLLDRYGYGCALYGHFGQGCVHTRIDFDLVTAAGIRKFRAFLHEAADLVLSHGGSLSGEHGDGQSRAELLPKMYGAELCEAFREFKAIWDPEGRMNPGKVVDAFRADENLRLGAAYAPPHRTTHFRFPDDDGSFARAAERCVGVGECRRAGGGTMCPSYMVTREEKHSTRGRARLLFEMLRGEAITGGWRDEHVKDALDLCLACKGCKGDCPMNVDMATYKAEFLSHYYAGRLRPRAAYAMGLIHWWARAAAVAPGVANALARARLTGPVLKWLAGVAPQRQLPALAPQTFRQWFHARVGWRPAGDPVVLWTDTFSDHFFPATARHAVAVLEAAGARVEIPPRVLCCGRPLYDWGMLDLAASLLRKTLETLRPAIRAGVPVVVLEPSCLAVFRDELPNLFPDDLDARRLSRQAVTLAGFLATRTHYVPPRLSGRALLHGHCHQKALIGVDAEARVLAATGLDVEVLDAGCCGMAGSFGFERDHYDVSVAVGERALLPAVRAAAADTVLVADGFSCREQIAQTTGRATLHLADILAPPVDNRIAVPERDGHRRLLRARPAMVGLAAVAVGVLASGVHRRRAG